ncbi:transcription factor/nuclear export subunit protein 2-domain-containing protein [Paraphoma chrysanthemicola]|nr:transcription factor/nuclear export subunit protein 2-domain-containing protein [Paraphoma chrysanthemicola]
MAPPKRKRPDRQYSQDNERPSPHRPEQLRMGLNHNQNHNHNQQSQQGSPRGGGNQRRQSRNGGRGGSSVPQSPNVSHASPTAMSPPANSFPSSRPSQATHSAPAPPSNQPAAPTATRDVPESNEYLTPQRVARWNAEARSAVVQAATSAQRDGDVLTLSVIFHEIIEAALDHQMAATELGSLVRDIVTAPSVDDVDPVSTFLDTLSSLTLDKDKQALAQQMLMATDLDVSRMRNELESDLLGSLGLVRDSFGKMAVRKATHALYRQSNYNLLREETEGYSKLMTEYFTTVQSKPPTRESINQTYQRVNALIGAFDLDIGRVLDVTLDVFANLIVKHNKFFVKLLRSTAWWPEVRGMDGIEWEEPDVKTLPSWAEPESDVWYCSEEEKEEKAQLREQRDKKFWKRVGELGERAGIQAYFELGARRITTNNRPPELTIPAEGAPLSKQQAARKWADEWIEQTGTLPPPSNDIAAQLLGFKLRFYASDTRDAQDSLPDNLVHLAALLIKVGFMSLLDLYPHLYPREEDMAAHKEKLMKAKKEKEAKERGAVRNALTMSGALPDDTPPGPPAVSRLRDAASKSESERSTPAKSEDAADRKNSLPEPVDQKYQLLKSLLCIGAIPESLFILGRHPWLIDVYPDLNDLLCRIAHRSLSKMYEATRPPADLVPVAVKGSGLKIAPRPCDYIPRKTLKWPKLDARDAGFVGGEDYKFYWEEWIDNVPVCQEVDDVVKFCTSFLGLLGPECGRDIVLLTKIVRIARKSYADDPSETNRKRWVDFCATFIAPALSFTGSNPGIVNEVWALIKHFDTATRYSIYQQWFTATKPASLRAQFEKVAAKTKYDLDRVAASNTKEYGRKIAKISYASPGIVFQLTLKRLISYPNMIDTLVECVKYLTLLGYDCLTWTLVNFFLRPEKGGTQDDGMLAAPWLKNIASFVGKAYHRHAFMDPTPVLQYITHQLLQTEGELFMLDVLEQILQHMGGISIGGSLSENMILSLCAGPMLRKFAYTFYLKDNRHLSASSAKRLARYLKDTGLAPQILVALAQHVEAYAYRDDQQDAPDKVVLFNLDKMRANLLQYLEFLRSYFSEDDFDNLFPGPIAMIADYGVEPEIAFTVARGSIAAKADESRTRKRLVPPRSERQSNGDIAMSDADEKTGTNGPTGLLTNADKENKDVSKTEDSEDVEMKDLSATDAASGALVPIDTHKSANPAIESLAEQLKLGLPETFGEHPCVSFYITFWQLSLPNVDHEGFKDPYRGIIAHYERKLPPPVPERRGYNPSVPRKETDEMRQAKIDIGKLQIEEQEAIMASNLTQTHLRLEMRTWFDGVPMLNARSDALHSALLQDCFIPRSRMSLEDAQFAAAMLKFMHNSGVPGFRTAKLLDLLFNANKLACIVRMYSDDEAFAFGRFLNSILRELFRWHENKDDAYAKSAHGPDKKLPGFGRRFDSDRNPLDHLQYADFCNLLYKWHKALFAALKSCLDSGDFQQIRNSLVILTACSGSFPKVDTMARELETTIRTMSKEDPREDVKTAAGSSLASFNKPMQSEWKFRNLPEPAETAVSTNGTNEAAGKTGKTPQPSDSTTAKLKPTAPAFKPRTDTNGASRSSSEKLDAGPQDRASSTPAATIPLGRDREISKASTDRPDNRSAATPKDETATSRSNAGTSAPPVRASPVPPRPEGRNTPQPAAVGKPAHILPTRPDPQPNRFRQPDRPGSGPDRPMDYGQHNRYDNRPPPNDYGRLDRPGDAARPRDGSPGRRGRPMTGGRTPERPPLANEHRDWSVREPREYEDRSMRVPPRDVRDSRGPSGRPTTWEPRDARDVGYPRDRPDSRGQAAPPVMDTRRIASSSSLAHDHNSHRHELPPSHSHHGQERNDHGPSRPSPAATSPTAEGPTVNPARAALINQEQHGRPEPSRPDRDGRRDRISRPQSPRRGEERRGEERYADERGLSGYHGRNEMPRDHRDERGPPPLPHPSARNGRDEPGTSTPTGPRGGRNEPPSPAGASREMFQPPRPSRGAQDPNYGRLNQPSESMPPSGPRSDRPQSQPQQSVAPPPSGPASSTAVGIHPSRMNNIDRAPAGPALQTNMPPSGPRGSGRAAQGSLPSPSSRGPPTGPAGNDRGPRGRNALGAVNNILTQNAPPPDLRTNDRSATGPNPPVRGRGSTRANGPPETAGGTSSPMPPPSQHGTPSSRSEGQHGRSNRMDNPAGRMEGPPVEEGRLESRGHRDSRRGERSGRERSHSPDRADRRPEERSGRNGPPRVEGEERGSERDRGSGREKRGSDRESSSRREREREGERSAREPRESRDGSRRERGSRDDGRPSGREDRRSRGGAVAGADDGRKRARDPQDQGQGHGDPKRRR